MATTTKPHVWYMGDWVFLMGPIFVETPFDTTETKNCELRFYGRRLSEALQPVAEVTCTSNWDLYRLEPGKLEAFLEQSAAVIVSDVEAKCFHLYPSFFNPAREKNEIVTFPDRLVALKNWVHDGGGMMMLGGWLSFSGAKETGGWRRTCVAEALPVECLVGEDLVESSAGFTPEVLIPDHPVAQGLPWKSFPPIFGYNELVAKSDSQVIARVKETGHPLIVAGRHGKGRILIYASDPAPHWGINFEQWQGYNQFWQQALAWVSRGAE